MQKLKKGTSTALKILFVYWLILFLTDKATFIYSSSPKDTADNFRSVITCTYIGWPGLMSRNYHYSADGITGIKSCPSIQNVKDLRSETF